MRKDERVWSGAEGGDVDMDEAAQLMLRFLRDALRQLLVLSRE